MHRRAMPAAAISRCCVQVVEQVRQEAGLIIDREKTIIGLMELSINMEELFSGSTAKQNTETAEKSRPKNHPALLQVGVNKFVLSAPGLRLYLHDLRVVVHHSTGEAVTTKGSGYYYDPPRAKEEEQEDEPGSPLPHAAAAAPPQPDAAARSGSPGEQSSSPGEEEEEEDPLADLSATPNFAANVLSEWILKDCQVELEGLSIKGASGCCCSPANRLLQRT